MTEQQPVTLTVAHKLTPVAAPGETQRGLPAGGERCMARDLHSGATCCAEAGLVEVWLGCVHEHMRTGRLCLFHAEEARAGKARCGPCRGVDGHECALHVLGQGEAGEAGVLQS